jgi:IS605 OrfB family transposase
MSKQTALSKTIKYRVLTSSSASGLSLFEQILATTNLYRTCVSFFIQILKDNTYILDLETLQLKQQALEHLVHQTKNNPNPPYSLASVDQNIPAYFRRSAINAALGIAGSWFSTYQKEVKKNHRAPALRIPNLQWPVYFAGMYKDFTSKSVMLKLFTGHAKARPGAWVWRKVAISTTQTVPEGSEEKSLKIITRGRFIYLHRPVIKKRPKPTNLLANRVCAVDLNIHRTVVMGIVDSKGRVLRTKFISTRKDNHLRKGYLDLITTKQAQTKIRPEGEGFCIDLWDKIHHFNDDLAHHLSRCIVDFAVKYRCATIVFEHLGNLQPERGSKSRWLNSKLMYWLKGSIYRKTLYKAHWEGLRVARVNPRYTSQMCSKHPGLTEMSPREGMAKPVGTRRPRQNKFICDLCGYEVDADFNAVVNIAKKYFAREQVQKALGGDIQAWRASKNPENGIRFFLSCMDPLVLGPGNSRVSVSESPTRLPVLTPRPRTGQSSLKSLKKVA